MLSVCYSSKLVLTTDESHSPYQGGTSTFLRGNIFINIKYKNTNGQFQQNTHLVFANHIQSINSFPGMTSFILQQRNVGPVEGHLLTKISFNFHT